MRQVIEIEANGYFLTTLEDQDLTVGLIATGLPIDYIEVTLLIDNQAVKTMLYNGITIYGNDNTR